MERGLEWFEKITAVYGIPAVDNSAYLSFTQTSAMPLKVIGSGMGRTGTHTLKLALEQLGFGKCYHMVELFRKPANLTYFTKAEKGEKVNWDTLFEGYQSAVDYPVARFHKQLMEKYPDAKIIHTIRDAEAWYQSASETIFWA